MCHLPALELPLLRLLLAISGSGPWGQEGTPSDDKLSPRGESQRVAGLVEGPGQGSACGCGSFFCGHCHRSGRVHSLTPSHGVTKIPRGVRSWPRLHHLIPPRPVPKAAPGQAHATNPACCPRQLPPRSLPLPLPPITQKFCSFTESNMPDHHHRPPQKFEEQSLSGCPCDGGPS